jgi:hypothetical protein
MVNEKSFHPLILIAFFQSSTFLGDFPGNANAKRVPRGENGHTPGVPRRLVSGPSRYKYAKGPYSLHASSPLLKPI